MTPENYSNFGFEYYEKGRSVVDDRFVGRRDALSRFAEILEYPRRGKEMPSLLVTGISGSGKSWLLSKFISILENERLPYIPFELRNPLVGNLPGAFIRFAQDANKRYGLKTPRFNRVKAIFNRRFRGVIQEEANESAGFIKDIFRSITGGSDPGDIPSRKMYREFGDSWETTLSSKPLDIHLYAMALALAEDIDFGLERKKHPFITIILDSWHSNTDRFAPHWQTLFANSSRLFAIIASRRKRDFHDICEIELTDFDESEIRETLERRGIGAEQAIARILGQTGGSPLTASLAASLAELIARKGDIIRSDTFDVSPDKEVASAYCEEIWGLMRDSEQFASAAAVRAPDLPPELLIRLLAQRADLPMGLNAACYFFPFDPPFSAENPVNIHHTIEDTVEELSHNINIPNIGDLSRRAGRLLERENLLEWEILDTRFSIHFEPADALSKALERIMALRTSGEFDTAEAIWRCSHPKANLALATIHRVIGYELLCNYLPESLLKQYFDMETDTVIMDAEYVIEHARIIGKKDSEMALRELQDSVGSLSAAITETSGGEPSLWYLRGRALLLASKIIERTGVYGEVLSSAQKASESFERTLKSDLDPAGVVSLESAKAKLEVAIAEMGLGEYRSSLAWLNKAIENLETAREKRSYFTADIAFMKAEILTQQGEILLKTGNKGEAEESYNCALEELAAIGKEYRQLDTLASHRTAEIQLALAKLLRQTGSQESAQQAVANAQAAFDRYEKAIGGGDPAGWLGRGKALLIEGELLSTENITLAIDKTRKARLYFDKAWEAGALVEAATGEIEALIFEGNLLSEENGDFEQVFNYAEDILLHKLAGHSAKVAVLTNWIELAKSRGRAAFMAGDNDLATKHFADAIRGYSDLHAHSPEIPFVSDLAEVHQASAIAFRKGGEPIEAFKSLKRAHEAYEIAADKSTERGRKAVLQVAIGVYNDLAATGQEDENFEAALFVLSLISQIGGQEAISTGHELLVYWESQELSFKDKHRLDEVASALQEYWGQ